MKWHIYFYISKYATWHDKQQDIVFRDVTFGWYVVLHFVYVYQISRCHITKGDHSTVHTILKHPDLPLLLYCLIPMKYIMKNSGYNEHMAKCPSYELLSHWTPLQKCVNTWTVRIKPRFNVPQISKLECFFLFEKWLELKYTCTQIYTIWSLWEDWHPQTKDTFCNTALEVVT